MVNKRNVSRYGGSPPVGEGDRVISDGPLYDLVEVVAKAKIGHLMTWTTKCQKDLRDNLGMDLQEIAQLMADRLPTNARYRNSEWCENGKGTWAACDAYTFTHNVYVASMHRNIPLEIYIKFGILNTGGMLLLVSCHSS